MTAAQWFIAGATLVLAIATFVMASYTRSAAAATRDAVSEAARAATAAENDLSQTRELVRLTQDQVAAAQSQADATVEALSAESQPLLIAATGLEDDPGYVAPSMTPVSHSYTGPAIEAPRVARWFIERPPHVWLIVKVRNIGRGPALIGPEAGDVQLKAEYGNEIFGGATSLVVPSGDFVYLCFVDHSDPSNNPRSLMSLWQVAGTQDEATSNVLRVLVRYSDATKARWTRTHLKFQLQSEGKMSLRLVDFEWDV